MEATEVRCDQHLLETGRGCLDKWGRYKPGTNRIQQGTEWETHAYGYIFGNILLEEGVCDRAVMLHTSDSYFILENWTVIYGK